MMEVKDIRNRELTRYETQTARYVRVSFVSSPRILDDEILLFTDLFRTMNVEPIKELKLTDTTLMTIE